MKVENRELLIEIKGKLDGIAYFIDAGAADALCSVVELLDVILKDEEEKKG